MLREACPGLTLGLGVSWPRRRQCPGDSWGKCPSSTGMKGPEEAQRWRGEPSEPAGATLNHTQAPDLSPQELQNTVT